MASTTTRRRTTIALSAAILAVGGLSACGSGADATGDGSDETTPDETTPDETSDDAGGDATATFSGDVCTLGADALTAASDPEGDSEVSATPRSPTMLSLGQGCAWDGDYLMFNVDVSSFDDFVPVTDSRLLDPQPVPDLGPDAWVQGAESGVTPALAFRRDGVSVYVSELGTASAEVLTQIAAAIDADLRAAGV